MFLLEMKQCHLYFVIDSSSFQQEIIITPMLNFGVIINFLLKTANINLTGQMNSKQ